MCRISDLDTWTGGFYELMLQFGSRKDEALLVNGLRGLWGVSQLEGPFAARTAQPTEQPILSIDRTVMEAGHPIYGLAQLDARTRIACGSYVIRDLDGRDWVQFCVPLGTLQDWADTGGFPFDHRDHAFWRQPLENWLADLGRAAWPKARFDLAVIGFEIEVREIPSRADLAAGKVPASRSVGLLVPRGHLIQYFPRTTRF